MAQALLEEAPTLFINAKLIDGKGGEPVEDGAVRVEGNRITQVGRTRRLGREPEREQPVLDLKGKTLMPGLTEGHFHISFWGVRELPDLDLKLPGRALDDLRGEERGARSALRVHLGGQRRRPAPRRRDDPRRDPGGDHRRAAARRLGPRHLRDERDARLEPLVLAARDGGPRDLRRRRRRGPQGRPPEHQGGLRRRQDVRHRRGPAPRPPGHPAGGDDVLARGDQGGGPGGAHAQPADRGARAAATTASSCASRRAST